MAESQFSKGVGGALSRYWTLYGGWRAVLRSRYFWSAVVLTLACYPFWSTPAWVDMPTAVLPNVLGFSLGGYAILVSFGDDKFKAMLANTKPGQQSKFLRVNATFVHFIVVQVLALVLAIVGKAWVSPDAGPARRIVQLVASGIGFAAFLYSLLLAVAAVLAVFQLGQWFEEMKRREASPAVPPVAVAPGVPPALGAAPPRARVAETPVVEVPVAEVPTHLDELLRNDAHDAGEDSEDGERRHRRH